MRFKSIIIVKQTKGQVWEFLANPLNSTKWDKSIDKVILPESGFTGKGCRIVTIAPSGKQQTFMVTQYQTPNFFSFQLLKSSMFKFADLSFKIEEVIDGTQITHEINIKLHASSFFLSPILLLTQKKSLSRDMQFLKKALDNNYPLK